MNEDLSYRQIFLDGRELPKDPNPAWMGYSIGHWDGDTLVVESTGYNERTWIGDGYPHTENMHITERIRRGRAESCAKRDSAAVLHEFASS